MSLGHDGKTPWVPTDEAFVVVRERDLRQVLSEGLSQGSGYSIALREWADAEAFAQHVFGQGYAILRIDMTNLGERVDPDVPMRQVEWIDLPPRIGEHTFLTGHIPPSEITDAPADPAGPGGPGPH